MRVVILYNQVSGSADAAERDVLVQAEAVESALGQLGHEPIRVECTLRLDELQERLAILRPDVVFNLVESLAGSDWMAHVATSLLDVLKLPYTGSPTEAMMISNDKLLAKRLLRLAGLPTPDWMLLAEDTLWISSSSPFFAPRGSRHGQQNPLRVPEQLADAPSPHAICSEVEPKERVYLVKAIREHASVGLDDRAVVRVRNWVELQAALAEATHRLGRPVFAEHFIDGREFNLSMLAGPNGPEVLPPAEIDFSAFPPGKARIVGYAAKWEEKSFEYHHTPRRFDFPVSDGPLLERLSELALACWHLFHLGGYARVDFRVDPTGQPWILEINTNPCLSPEAGFAAAVQQAGLTYPQAIQRILQDALNRSTKTRQLPPAAQVPNRTTTSGIYSVSQTTEILNLPSCADRVTRTDSVLAPSPELAPRTGLPDNLGHLPEGYQFRDQPRPDDREAVRQIVASTGFFSPAEIEVADELVQERLRAGPASGYHFLFLEQMGQVIGYACYGPIPATVASFDLYWIAVHRRWQGRGLGRAILQEVERRIRQAGGGRIYIDTSGRPQYEPTRRFYQQCGYQCQARLPDFYAPGDDKLIYCKVLEKS
ncbi:MAG: GNAT family N-acetyltransferase [Thermoguttaceae bacterium]|nr:GNAT family N-acetyltransferase [Thermoguttaceae bacterium]MDW8037462.1 GNAT family N-acetyltransferase [Thermoguttaceae bacterium]